MKIEYNRLLSMKLQIVFPNFPKTLLILFYDRGVMKTGQNGATLFWKFQTGATKTCQFKSGATEKKIPRPAGPKKNVSNGATTKWLEQSKKKLPNLDQID